MLFLELKSTFSIKNGHFEVQTADKKGNLGVKNGSMIVMVFLGRKWSISLINGHIEAGNGHFCCVDGFPGQN